ncbi:hypothetical protein GCM10023231_05970 [Olivibacter ginsenosidimutans]|uniref:DUF4293 family protein n=1 Tax=Olivibacter ginsenosidimutans TaxID=1176537 RepID=A0ABP9AJK6_9SPHI
MNLFIYPMIQRIQTIWLLLASVTILALFLFPYVQYIDTNGIAMALKVTGKLDSAGGQNQLNTSFVFVLQTIATVLLGFLPLLTIAQYKNRKKQVSFILITIVLVLLFALWLYIAANNALIEVSKTLNLSNIGIGTLLIPINLIFLILALKGVKKDIKLIRSVDRLR